MRAPTEAADASTCPTTFDLETVFESDYRRIARIVGRMIGDPGCAEDLTVEAFWRLSQTPGAQGPNAGGWLYRTAVRLAVDELRRRTRRARYEPFLMFFSRAPRTPHDLFSTSEKQEQVRAVLAAMGRNQVALLLLRSDGVPYEEIAAILSLNPASVGTLLSRAKAAFRKEYVKRYGEQ